MGDFLKEVPHTPSRTLQQGVLYPMYTLPTIGSYRKSTLNELLFQSS